MDFVSLYRRVWAPFSNNTLGVASANAGALGLFSTSGLCDKKHYNFSQMEP